MTSIPQELAIPGISRTPSSAPIREAFTAQTIAKAQRQCEESLRSKGVNSLFPSTGADDRVLRLPRFPGHHPGRPPGGGIHSAEHCEPDPAHGRCGGTARDQRGARVRRLALEGRR
jgi:hypothetical protein